MPSIRVGFSSDLNITGGNTGIGTATPTARLEVSGGIVAERITGGGGISTFKEYQGFSQTLATLPHEIATEEGVFSSLTGEIKITGETTVSSGSTVEVGKTKTLTVTDRFAVPLGETNNRDLAPEAGTTRFNQDFGTLEFFDGANWKTVNSYARGGAAGRGLSGGGADPSNTAHIDYMNMTTRGNGLDFGDRTIAANNASGCSSSTRGLFCGGNDGSAPNKDTIDYVTIASAGNAVDFGNLTNARFSTGSCGSSTRGLTGGGNPASNIIDYHQFSTLGNSLDFGDLNATQYGVGSASSPTRGFWVGGTVLDAKVQMVTIASKGNAIDFGFITNGIKNGRACSNNTQLLYGRIGVDKFDMSSGGNAIKFGDLTVSSLEFSSSFSSQTRGFWTQGRTPTNQTTINMIEMSSGGDAIDFGDMTLAKQKCAGLSDSHGGLGGF